MPVYKSTVNAQYQLTIGTLQQISKWYGSWVKKDARNWYITFEVKCDGAICGYDQYFNPNCCSVYVKNNSPRGSAPWALTATTSAASGRGNFYLDGNWIDIKADEGEITQLTILDDGSHYGYFCDIDLTLTTSVSTYLYSHFIGIKNDGTLWGVGYNLWYAMGDGTTTNKTSPVQIGSDTDWKLLVDENRMFGSTFAIKNNGYLYAWGNGDKGAFGDGNGTYHALTTPTLVSNARSYSFVTSNQGATYTCFAISNGALYSCGINSHGGLGLGDTTNRSTLTQVGSDTNWAKVFVGGAAVDYTGYLQCSTFALKTDGTLYVCGFNAYYNLGLGNGASRSTFIQLGSSTWSDILATGFYTLGIKTDGTLWMWGYWNNGQVQYATPTQVGAESDYVSFASKANCGTMIFHTVRRNGKVTYFQLNNSGGTTPTFITLSAVQVFSDTDLPPYKICANSGINLSPLSGDSIGGNALPMWVLHKNYIPTLRYSTPATVNIYAVGGGGGGGCGGDNGAGGGGGGVVGVATGLSVTRNQIFEVNVGRGGYGCKNASAQDLSYWAGTIDAGPPKNGEPTIIRYGSTVVSLSGGGAGGNNACGSTWTNTANGQSGGNGGGGCGGGGGGSVGIAGATGSTGTAPTGWTFYGGYTGGRGYYWNASPGYGGAGGGAGAAGNGNNGNIFGTVGDGKGRGGNGGSAYTINGNGLSNIPLGGGGGGGSGGAAVYIGFGSGGGGDGGGTTYGRPTNGREGTGAGGGGGGGTNAPASGNGGSGVAIFTSTSPARFQRGAAESSSGGYYIYHFFNGGVIMW